MPLRLGEGNVVARIGFADMRGVGTFALGGIAGKPEIIVALRVGSKPGIVAQRCAFQRSTAPPAADYPGGEQFPIHSEPRCLLGDEFAEFGHFLLEAPKYHVRTVAHPRRRHVRRPALFDRIVRVLARISEYEFTGPDQILARQPLIGPVSRLRWPRQPADAGLRGRGAAVR